MAARHRDNPSPASKLCFRTVTDFDISASVKMMAPISSHTSDRDDRMLRITNGIVHLWLAIEFLDASNEISVGADIRAIMEELGMRHQLPVIEADLFANHTGEL